MLVVREIKENFQQFVVGLNKRGFLGVEKRLKEIIELDNQRKSAQERADFAAQLEQYQLESAEEAEEWRQRFAQSQEQQRIADAIQRRDLEASLADFGNQYQRDWAEGSRALQSDYQRIIADSYTNLTLQTKRKV